MDNRGNIVIYQTKDGKTSIDVKLEDETVWLTQAQMAELFQTDRTSIVKHVNNIYKSEELVKDSTCAKIAHVQIEDISHCFSCSDAASLTLIEAIFFCLSLILRCLLLPAYHNTPFDMSGGSGKRKFAKSLKVRAGQYLVITEIRGQQSVYLFVGAWH